MYSDTSSEKSSNPRPLTFMKKPLITIDTDEINRQHPEGGGEGILKREQELREEQDSDDEDLLSEIGKLVDECLEAMQSDVKDEDVQKLV